MATIKPFKETLALFISRSLVGTITILGLLIAISGSSVNFYEVLGIIVLTLASLVLTRFFAEMIQKEIRLKRRIDRREKWELLKPLTATFYGGLFPFIIFILAGIQLLTMSEAFVISNWGLLGVLFICGFMARELAGAGWWHSIVSGVFYSLLGLGIIGLKSLIEIS